MCLAALAWLVASVPAAGYEFEVLRAPVPASESLPDGGHALAAGEGWVVLGAPGEDSASGAVHVFQCGPASCVHAQRLQAGDPRDREAFGAALSLAGSRLAVGSPARDDGHVDLFELQAGIWVHVQRLDAPDGESNGRFGWSLALADDRLLVGAPAVDGETGAVYAFARDSGVWGFRQRLAAPTPTPGDRFGISVSLSGDLALAGLPGHDPDADGPAYARGAAAAFAFDGLGWQPQGLVLASAGENGDLFGSQVALLGSRAAVGVPGSLARTGRVDVFEHDGMAWMGAASLTPMQPRAGGRFGWSVSLGAPGILVAAPFPGDDGSEACGTLEWFEPDGMGGWSGRLLQARTGAASAVLGFALAHSQDAVVATAPLLDGAGAALRLRPGVDLFADSYEASRSGCRATLP